MGEILSFVPNERVSPMFYFIKLVEEGGDSVGYGDGCS